MQTMDQRQQRTKRSRFTTRLALLVAPLHVGVCQKISQQLRCLCGRRSLTEIDKTMHHDDCFTLDS